jgi:hypothetical protein
MNLRIASYTFLPQRTALNFRIINTQLVGKKPLTIEAKLSSVITMSEASNKII